MKGFTRKNETVANFNGFVVLNAHAGQGTVEIRFTELETDDHMHISLDADDLLRIKHVLPKSTREINLERENAQLRIALEGMEAESLRFQEAMDGRRSING